MSAVEVDGDAAARKENVARCEEEICTYNLRGGCNYGAQCRKYHSQVPYLWQYKVNSPRFRGLRFNSWCQSCRRTQSKVGIHNTFDWMSEGL